MPEKKHQAIESNIEVPIGLSTITDFNSIMIDRWKRPPKNKKRLEQAKRAKELFKKSNYKLGAAKRRISKQLIAEERPIEIAKLKQQWKEASQGKVDLSSYNNEINMLEGKDFYFAVDDNFRISKVKYSTMQNKDNPAFYLTSLFKRHVNEFEKRELAKDEPNEKKLQVLDKLKNKIEYNSKLLKEGKETYDEVPEGVEVWEPGKLYEEDKIIFHKGTIYRNIEEHESEDETDFVVYWKKETDPPMFIQFFDEGLKLNI